MSEYRVTITDGYQHQPHRFDYWASRNLYFEARNVFLNDSEWRPWDKVPVSKVREVVKVMVHDFVDDGERQWYDYYLRSFKNIGPGEFAVVVAQDWLD